MRRLIRIRILITQLNTPAAHLERLQFQLSNENGIAQSDAQFGRNLGTGIRHKNAGFSLSDLDRSFVFSLIRHGLQEMRSVKQSYEQVDDQDGCQDGIENQRKDQN